MSNFAKTLVTAALPILIVRFRQLTRQNGLIKFECGVCNSKWGMPIVKHLHHHTRGALPLRHVRNYMRLPSQLSPYNFTPLKPYANTNKEVRRMMWCRTSKGMIRGC
jgi:hypothetical protein